MHKDWKALKRAFVDDGYINLSSWLDEDLVQRVLTDSLEYKGISIFERESVGDLLCHPQILEFVEFLLEVDTDRVAISPFRFWNHLSAGGVSDGGG